MKNNKLKMIESYRKYGYDFPVKATYHRPENIIPFATDFKDGEEIEFWWSCEKPSACAIGNAFYINKNRKTNLVNIKNLSEHKEENEENYAKEGY